MHNRIRSAAILLLILVASASSAATRDEAVSAVKGRYRITTPSFLGGFSEIGSVLTPRREGLRANRPSKVFKPNVIENRRLTAVGGGDLPLGAARDGALQPGERLYLYGVDTGDDYVQLDLYTVTTYVVSGMKGGTPLQATVRFRYDGGLAGVTTRQLLDDIGEWLAAEGEARPAANEPPPTVQVRPPAAGQPVPGTTTGAIRPGQTPEEVTAILGLPEKTIFIYRDRKVEFVDGKVTGVEQLRKERLTR